MTKRAILSDIILCCEHRFNTGDSRTWKHGDFVNLSREIMQDTGVNISPNTLKRIFGKIAVDDDYLPQQATLDALKQYGNYNLTITEPEFLAHKTAQEYPHSFQFQSFFIIASLVATFLFLFFIATKIKNTTSLIGNISVSHTEGKLPQTVFFTLQLPHSSDSLFVNFGDKSPLVYLNPNQKTIAHIYLFPALFTASIQTRQHLTASTKVYVRSDKWIGLGFHNQRDLPNRHYEFPALKTGKDSLFSVTNQQLYKTGMDTVGHLYVRLCNYTPTNYQADDFIFESTFKNKLHEDGIYCNSTKFQIAGSNNMIRFMFANQGCSFGILNYLSEQVFDGSKRNLSQFIVNLKEWNRIRLVNRHKQVSLFVNDKLIFKGIYQQPLGEIKGIFLEFAGNGLVKECTLKTSTGKTLYHF